jgi:hypothetical protein
MSVSQSFNLFVTTQILQTKTVKESIRVGYRTCCVYTHRADTHNSVWTLLWLHKFIWNISSKKQVTAGSRPCSVYMHRAYTHNSVCTLLCLHMYSKYFVEEAITPGSRPCCVYTYFLYCFTAEPIRMFVNSLGVAQTIIQHLTLELDVFQHALWATQTIISDLTPRICFVFRILLRSYKNKQWILETWSSSLLEDPNPNGRNYLSTNLANFTKCIYNS